jgi:hypothetical protein
LFCALALAPAARRAATTSLCPPVAVESVISRG